LSAKVLIEERLLYPRALKKAARSVLDQAALKTPDI
jgi:hypothetical protein